MRIAYVSDQLLPRTATDTAQTLSMVSALGAAGAEIDLVLPVRWGGAPASVELLGEYYGVEPSFGVRTLRSLYPGVRGVEKISHAVRAVSWRELQGYDLVYTRNLPVVCAAVVRGGSRVLYETYRPWPRQQRSKRALFEWLARRDEPVGLVLHSELAAGSYREVGFADERLLVAYNGFDLSRIGRELAPVQAREQCGLDPARFTVTYAGRVAPGKGLLLVLDMAERLPEVQFVLVGSEGPGPVERRAARLHNVQVVGWLRQSDALPYLQAADVLLIPPAAGPLERVGNTVLPIKTFLYLALGRAILAPRTPDLEEILRDGENALLVEPEDVAGAVDRLRELSQSPTLGARLGQAARLDAEDFTWAKRATRVLDFVRERLGASG